MFGADVYMYVLTCRSLWVEKLLEPGHLDSNPSPNSFWLNDLAPVPELSCVSSLVTGIAPELPQGVAELSHLQVLLGVITLLGINSSTSPHGDKPPYAKGMVGALGWP